MKPAYATRNVSPSMRYPQEDGASHDHRSDRRRLPPKPRRMAPPGRIPQRHHHVSQDGKPVAALVDAELFARIRRMSARFDDLSARIANAYAEVPMEQRLAEVDSLVMQDRSQ